MVFVSWASICSDHGICVENGEGKSCSQSSLFSCLFPLTTACMFLCSTVAAQWENGWKWKGTELFWRQMQACLSALQWPTMQCALPQGQALGLACPSWQGIFFWDILDTFKPDNSSSPRLSYWQCCAFPAEQKVFLVCGFKPMSVCLSHFAASQYTCLFCFTLTGAASGWPSLHLTAPSLHTEAMQGHNAEGKMIQWLLSWIFVRCTTRQGIFINGSKSLLNLPAPCTTTRSWSITTLMVASLLEVFWGVPNVSFQSEILIFHFIFQYRSIQVTSPEFFSAGIDWKLLFGTSKAFPKKKYSLHVSFKLIYGTFWCLFTDLTLFILFWINQWAECPWHSSGRATYILQKNNLRDWTLKMEKPWILLHAFCFWLVVFC